jgi:hypothetical protein
MKNPSAVARVFAVLVCAACSEADSPVDPFAGLENAPAFARGGAASAAPAFVALPFNGRFVGTQTVTPLAFPEADVAVSASGVATKLGRFTIELPHRVNFVEQSAVGIATLVAANGDMIVARFEGTAQLGAIVSIVEEATITGGTGRFADATGSFTIERLFYPAAGTTVGTFRGWISPPHAGE